MFVQRPTLVNRDMIGGVTANLELRVIRRAVPRVTLPLEVADMHLDDRSADTTGFRVPTHVVADFEGRGQRRADAVADDSTALLMAELYASRVKRGEGVAAALRKAQMKLIRGPSYRTRHPYFWASFVLLGNPI